MNFLSRYSSFTRNVDFAGRIIYNDKEQEIFNFGKYKNQPVAEVFRKDPAYYAWIQQGEFTLDTKKIATNIKLRDFNK